MSIYYAQLSLCSLWFCWGYVCMVMFYLIVLTIAAAHHAYPDITSDKFFATDLDEDAESSIQLIERKINFALGDASANPDAVANYTSSKKHCFLLYSEAQLRNGMKASLTLLPHGKTSERTLLLDFQIDEIKSVIDWKLNVVEEEIQKKFRTLSPPNQKNCG